MTCREFVDVIMAFLDGELGEEELAAFRTHFDRCPPCKHYLESYEATIRLGRAAFADPEAEVPAEVPEELVRAVMAARAQQIRR